MTIYTNAHRGSGFTWVCTRRDHESRDSSVKALFADRGGNNGYCIEHWADLLYNACYTEGICVPLNWPDEVRKSAIHFLTVLFPTATINGDEEGDEYFPEDSDD